MARRIQIVATRRETAVGVANMINEHYKIRIYDKAKDGIWGLNPDEQWVFLDGPGESLMNPKVTPDVRRLVGAYKALTHIIVCPLIMDQGKWGPEILYDAGLHAAYAFLMSNSDKRVPMIYLNNPDKRVNWSLITEFLSDIKIVKTL